MDSSNDKKIEKTKDSFGFQWNYFDEQDLNFFKNDFLCRSGLTEKDIKNKTILDVGCGMGRYTTVMAMMGAKKVVGIDYSDSVNAARTLIKKNKLKNVEIHRMDIFNLKLKNKFDIIFSFGVLHHTGNTEKAFNSIVKYLKKNGSMFIMIYEKQNIVKEKLNIIIRSVTTRARKDRILLFAKYLAFIEKIPIFNKIGHVFMHFGGDVCCNFDWYAPKIQDHHSEKEVVSWFKNAGFTQINVLSHPSIKSESIKMLASIIHGKSGGIIRVLGKR